MRKLLTRFVFGLLVVGAAATVGCSGEEKPDEYQTSALENLPFVYKMTVQQGNIITSDMVDQLELGMNKRQVRFLLGTPLLTDFFHADRWDYTYTLQRGHAPMETRYLTLFFQEDALTRIEGDIRPDAKRAAGSEPKEIVVEVPDYKERRGFFRRGLEVIGIGKED